MLDLEPENSAAHYALSVVYQTLGRTVDSFNHVERSYQIDPRPPSVGIDYGNHLYVTHHPQFSIHVELNGQIPRSPSSLKHSSKLTSTWKNNHFQVEKELPGYPDEDILRPFIFRNRALAYNKLEQNEESLKELEKFLQVDPSHREGILFKGLLLVQLNKKQDAIDYYKEKMATNPELGQSLWLDLGI